MFYIFFIYLFYIFIKSIRREGSSLIDLKAAFLNAFFCFFSVHRTGINARAALRRIVPCPLHLFPLPPMFFRCQQKKLARASSDGFPFDVI